MTEVQIKQIIGQLEASIKKIESKIGIEEFQEYCDAIAIAVAYWRMELKKVKNGM